MFHTGTCEVCRLAASDGITVNQKDDGDSSGCPRRSSGFGCGPCDDEINVAADQIRGQTGEALESSLAVPVFQGDVLALDPAEIAQTLPKRIIQVRGWTIADHADSPDFPRLLGLGGERRSEETARQRPNECPPVHLDDLICPRVSGVGRRQPHGGSPAAGRLTALRTAATNCVTSIGFAW